MRGNVSCLSIACTPSFSSACACHSSASVFLTYLSYFFPSFSPKLSQSQQWVSCRDPMEWPLVSPRAPMTFPAAATSPATMTYCPCVTAPRTQPRHPQKAPAPCSRGHFLHPALTACRHPGDFSQLSTNGPPSVSVCVQLDTEMLRWRDSHSSFGPCSLWLSHSHSFCVPEGGRGGKSVPHTSDHSPILFSYRTDHSNCCPASLWTSWSGT